MRTKEKARSRPWTKSFPSAGRRQQFNFFVWQVAFAWLRGTCPKAAEYLQETYFVSVKVENFQRQLRCSSTLWGAGAIWFAGFWSGCIGTYRGSSSGTQTLESFHGYWQKRVEARARAKPTEVFSLMQGSTKFEWGEKRVFAKWPTISAEALFNSESLRSAGRSPAVDFWTGRGRKLCGNREHKLL